MMRDSSRRVLLGVLALSAAALAACMAMPEQAAPVYALDTSVKPGDDFFQYANGSWIKANPIPAEYSRWGAFTQLRDQTLTELRGLVEGLDKGPMNADGVKIRTLYRTAMDEKARDARGAMPLGEELGRIERMNSRGDVVAEIGHLRAAALPSVFSCYVAQDEKQSDRYAVHVEQGGFSLPERDYYLRTTDEAKKLREQFRDHVAAMLGLLGDPPAAAQTQADAVLALETKLAEASRTPVDLRDAEKNYNKKTPAELAAMVPAVGWPAYFDGLHLTNVDSVIVGQPEYFARLNELLGSVPLADWKAYFRWHLVHAMAGSLSSAFENEDFHFFGEILHGTKEMRPRWKRALGSIDHQMGEALGRLYVQKYFTPQAKQRMDTLVKNLLTVYAERIGTRDWMGPETKKQALEKLSAMNTKIGYPVKWRDYSLLEIKEDSYANNVMRGNKFESDYRLARLHQPVDRNDWFMTPPTVNAYYDGTMNEIVFPAGILQPPFFDAQADDAYNYGGIGAVIGHEITHGFDDQGSKVDAHGNLRDWWTPEDRARFNAKAEAFAKQYDACLAVDDMHVNGHLTLGEDLADLGGVNIAYAAYQKSLGARPAPVIDGLTGDQRFFLGYARIWRDAVRDAELRVSLRTDPHAPARFRTLVPLSNFEPFYKAFKVEPGEMMYRRPEERVEVW